MTFAGSDRGGERAGAIYTLIETTKLNDVDPEPWLRDVLTRVGDGPVNRIAELIPWRWSSTSTLSTLPSALRSGVYTML